MMGKHGYLRDGVSITNVRRVKTRKYICLGYNTKYICKTKGIGGKNEIK